MTHPFWTENPAREEIVKSWKEHVEGKHTMAYHSTVRGVRGSIDFDEISDTNSTHWLIKGDLEYRKLVAAVGKDEAYKMTCALDDTRKGRYDAIKELVSRYTVPPVAAAVERGS